MEYQLMTALAFMQSYDRDVLEFQNDPQCYIQELEWELTLLLAPAYDTDGNKVWPIWLMKAHLDIQGNPQWPEQLTPPNQSRPPH